MGSKQPGPTVVCRDVSTLFMSDVMWNALHQALPTKAQCFEIVNKLTSSTMLPSSVEVHSKQLSLTHLVSFIPDLRTHSLFCNLWKQKTDLRSQWMFLCALSCIHFWENMLLWYFNFNHSVLNFVASFLSFLMNQKVKHVKWKSHVQCFMTVVWVNPFFYEHESYHISELCPFLIIIFWKVFNELSEILFQNLLTKVT